MLTLAGLLALAAAPGQAIAQAGGQTVLPIKQRHLDTSRQDATRLPRSEADQAVTDGWPLYRTERGQAAFNDAMATLWATHGPAPAPAAFKGCAQLGCHLGLPTLSADGWLPAGRLWLSPSEYVLFVRSPRLGEGQSYRRRGNRAMKVFVFHEFHNSSRNTDLYDTISSHSRHVFVPLYMSKQATDANGRRFVIVVQVAPYDVVSIHATNMGSAGPGIEVAKNSSDALEPLQGLAGILVATMIKTAAPHLKVVNHHGSEGLPMLNAYERRLAALGPRTGAPVALPFVHAQPQRVAAATGKFTDLVLAPGALPRIPVADREPLREPKLIGSIRLATRPAARAAPEPTLVGPITPAVRPAPLQGGGTAR